jgi:hypothetical protein
VVALVMLGAQAGPSAALADTSPVASFDQYATPADLPQHAGEPSIGVDWATGNVLFEASQNTLRVKFDDSTTPAAATWEDRTAPSSVFTADPILFTDPTLGRTFVSQLTILCSLASYSDNDGDTWTGPTQGCGVGLPEDHQTVGAGPYHQPAPLGAGILYPNAVYYCHQDGVLGFVLADGQAAYCALSITGSVTFANDVPIYTGLQCGGLHGHVKVGPDGTAYVPNQACDQVGFDPNLPGELYAHQAVVVSEDNGTSWQVRSVPDSKAVFYSDPQVAIGLNNTVYFAYQHGGEADGTGRHPRVAVSRDHGQTWAPSIDLGTSLGIENVEFPMVVAGDDGRAAVAFLGTTTPGDDQAADFNGVFDMYVSYTYDGGATWTTIDATPTDPVQRGCVQLVFATSHCPTRNLLDFNDVTIDQQGRVLVAYADGCIDACVTSTNPDDNGFDDQGVILRQSCGTGLFAAHDGELATCAAVTTPATPTTPAVATQPLPNTGAAMPLSLLALAAFGASAVLALTVVGRRARP